MKRIYAVAATLALAGLYACTDSPVASLPLDELAAPRYDSGGGAGSGDLVLPPDTTVVTTTSSILPPPEEDEGEGRSGGVIGADG
jgi:hypothetical protein